MSRSPLFNSGSAFHQDAVLRATARIDTWQDIIREWLTRDRLANYIKEISENPAPSTAALALRGPVLSRLWESDGMGADKSARFHPNYRNSGEFLVETGSEAQKPVLLVAHLDTISYLVTGSDVLTPNCYHLTEAGRSNARVLRYDLETGAFRLVAEGALVSQAGVARFEIHSGAAPLPGDRVAPVTPFRCDADGMISAHLDNAGGVAALAACVPLFADLGINAAFAFPDDEEGPLGSGNQMMSRGTARFAAAAGRDLPKLSVVVDMQQAGTHNPPGSGAILSEHSGNGRGVVTPQPFYASAAKLYENTARMGFPVCISDGTRISRSDDVSLMLRRRDILLLGFPGRDRHFDTAPPSAHIDDIVDLARALVCTAALAQEIQEAGHA
jgi:hypothetical protein